MSEQDPAIAQPQPIPNNKPIIVDLVVRDLQERAEAGLVKYGTKLQPHNGRDALIDAYQEALDLAMYLRQAIEERNSVVHYRAFIELRDQLLSKNVCLDCGGPTPCHCENDE